MPENVNYRNDISGDDANRITVEVTLGKKPAVPDTPAMREFRRRVSKEIKVARVKKQQIRIPD